MSLNVCPYCGGKILIKKYKQTPIPVPKGLKKKSPIYICENFPRCDSFVGCSKNSTKPRGMIADGELRKLRKTAHKLFDSIWKSQRMSREEAYKLMAELMGLSKKEAHIGKFNKVQCVEMIQKINDFILEPITTDEQWEIFLSRGLWYNGPSKFEPTPIPIIKRSENAYVTIPLEVTEDWEQETVKEIPERARYGERDMTFERQEEDFIVYTYDKKTSFGIIKTEYKAHIKTISRLLRKNQIKGLKNTESKVI